MKMNLNGFQRLIMRINGNWGNIYKYEQILSREMYVPKRMVTNGG